MDLKTGLENQPALLFKLKMDSERFAWPQTGNTSAKPADAFSLAFVLAKRRSHESSVYDTMICSIVLSVFIGGFPGHRQPAILSGRYGEEEPCCVGGGDWSR